MNKVVELTPEEVEITRNCVKSRKENSDEFLSWGGITQKKREEVINDIRTAESILKKLGEE